MNNKKYNQIIDEAYENYQWKQPKLFPAPPDSNLSQEEFINKCKTDPEFSEKWGLKIEERDLSLEERSKIWNETHNPAGNIYTHNQYNENNIPTKLITITYNNEKIEIYE